MRMSESLHKDSIGPVSVHDQKLPLGPEGFILESGKSLPEVSIRYETYGTLNPDKSNVIWICSPLTADAHVAGFYNPDDKHVGWWDALIGKGKPSIRINFLSSAPIYWEAAKVLRVPQASTQERESPTAPHFPRLPSAIWSKPRNC